MHLASVWKWGFLKLGSGLLVERWTWGGDLYNVLHWARRPRESRIDVHSLGLEYSCWYCRWHFYIFTRKHLRYLFLAYLLSTYLIETGCSFTGEIYGLVSFHSNNLIGNYREYSCDFLTLILLPVTHPWYAIKRQMRTLSNEPLYEYTRRQLAAKPELRPKVQTRMRNVFVTISPAVR